MGIEVKWEDEIVTETQREGLTSKATEQNSEMEIWNDGARTEQNDSDESWRTAGFILDKIRACNDEMDEYNEQAIATRGNHARNNN